MSKKETPLPMATSREKLARQYGVGIGTLKKWIDMDTELKQLIASYKCGRIRVYPPAVILKIYLVFGDPRDDA